LVARKRKCVHAPTVARADIAGTHHAGLVSAAMEKIKEIDGLRAIAILLVVAWHYFGASDGPQSLPWRIFIFGRIGVDLFFVLSGYLITSILLNNRASPNYFSAFYGRRAFRILPIYGVMLLIFFAGRISGAGHVFFDGALPWWSYALGVQNVWMTIDRTYGATWLAGTWSLAIEEQFYLLFPLIVLWLPPAALPRFLIATMVLCPAGRIISYLAADEFGYYVLMPLRADILAVGALIAWLRFSGPVSDRVRRSVKTTLVAAVCAFPVFAFLIGGNTDFHMALWGHSYLVVLFGSAVFMVLESTGSPSLALLRSGPAEFFARISYALYLVHINVLILVFLAFRTDRTAGTLQGTVLTALALAISVLICFVSYRCFEGPLIRMAHQKYRFEKSSGKASAKSRAAAAL